MTLFLIYLLKVSAWFIPFYMLYLLLYRRFTFFTANRIYLILTATLSFILPFVHIEYIETNVIWGSMMNVKQQIANSELLPAGEDIAEIKKAVINADSLWHWSTFVFWIYIMVATTALTKLLGSLLKIKALIDASRKFWPGNAALVFTTDKIAHSSFFQYIFLNKNVRESDDVQKIIYHEMQHNEKLHSFDVLFCELIKVVLWFNPAVYYFKKSVQEVHEFEVDNEMTKLYNEVTYAELLVKVATGKEHKLSSPFSSQPLKSRLKMIFNPKTYPMKKLSFLLVLPLIAILLMAYGNISFEKRTVVKSVNEKPLIVVDAGHGGEDPGAIEGTHTESTIALQMAKAIATDAESKGFEVLMVRSNDSTVNLPDRPALANAKNPVAYLSIHCNKAANKNKNGIECYISSTEHKYAGESKELAKKVLKHLQNVSGITTINNVLTRSHDILVLKEAKCPAVLLELGYMSNDKDLLFITNKNNQSQLAANIINGVTSYLEEKK